MIEEPSTTRLPLTEERRALALELLDQAFAMDMASAIDIVTNPKNYPPEDPSDGTF